MIPFFCLLIDKRNQKKPDTQLQCKTIQFNGTRIASSNLLPMMEICQPFNEIFCAIKGALCRELRAPYFSSSEVRSPAISQAYKGPSLYYVRKGTGWVESEKWQFLLTFSTNYAGVGWVGGSEKVKKCANVIQEWSLMQAGTCAMWQLC